MHTKNLKIISGLLLTVIGLSSCSSDDDSTTYGNWVEKSIFDGTARSSAVAFTIDNIGYTGTGYDGDDYLNDFWSYDIDGNFWSQVANFPGSERSSAVAFAYGNNGYVGTGYDGDDELADFYSYNTETETWTAPGDIADFPATDGDLESGRRSAIAFTTNNGGYVGTGNDGDNDLKDFYEYSVATNSWEIKPGFGGEKRNGAATFTIDEKVYITTGTSNGELKDDLWEFDLATETWTALNDLDDDDSGDDDILRSNAVGFNLGGKGYIACGVDDSGVIDTVWEYTPSSDSWDELNELEGSARQDAIAFSNGISAFVGLGVYSSLYYDDIFEFFPDDEEDDED